jgi:hypothetical protein
VAEWIFFKGGRGKKQTVCDRVIFFFRVGAEKKNQSVTEWFFFQRAE